MVIFKDCILLQWIFSLANINVKGHLLESIPSCEILSRWWYICYSCQHFRQHQCAIWAVLSIFIIFLSVSWWNKNPRRDGSPHEKGRGPISKNHSQGVRVRWANSPGKEQQPNCFNLWFLSPQGPPALLQAITTSIHVLDSTQACLLFIFPGGVPNALAFLLSNLC